MTIIDSLRKPRISNIALFDVIVSIIAVRYIAVFYNYSPWYGLLAIPIGIIIHYMFDINTELNYKLGISDKPK
jgi:ABC-type protease/lipase transport system fused ATPase/permease subunit